MKGNGYKYLVLDVMTTFWLIKTREKKFGTHVTTFKRVDSEQFVKLFTANIGLTFDLSSAGIKAFNVLLWAVQKQAFAKIRFF